MPAHEPPISLNAAARLAFVLRRCAPVLVGLVLGLTALKCLGCSLNPTPPDPHITDPDPAVSHIETSDASAPDASDASEQDDAGDDP